MIPHLMDVRALAINLSNTHNNLLVTIVVTSIDIKNKQKKGGRMSPNF